MGIIFSRPGSIGAQSQKPDLRAATEVIRPMGNLERFNVIRNYLKFYNNVGVTAVYRFPRYLLGASLLEDYIYAAFAEVLNLHPCMGVTIEEEGGPEPRWIRLPNCCLDLDEVIKFESADPEGNIDAIIQRDHRKDFTGIGKLPLWKAVVISKGSIEEDEEVSFAVAFYFHHAIGDGLSGSAFHLTFLIALENLLSSDTRPSVSEEGTRIITVPKLPLLPNLEIEAPFPISLFFLLKTIFRTLVYNQIDPLSWTGPIIDRNVRLPPDCNLRSFSISHDLVQNLVSKCRTRKTSITALVTVLVARKLALMYPQFSHFTGAVPFSIRKFMNSITERDMGVYISNIAPLFSSEIHPPSPYISCFQASTLEEMAAVEEDQGLWESARQCKLFIDTKASTNQNQTIGLLKFVKDYSKVLLAMLGGKRDYAFEVTNIGVVDGGAGGEGKVIFNSMVFSSSLSAYGGPYHFNIVTAKGGNMTVAMTWNTAVLDDEDAKEMRLWLEKQLQDLAKA